MTAPSDKELRRLLRESEIDPDLTVASEHARIYAFNADAEYEYIIADVHGGKERFAIAQLLALAPELARELLAARKVVRASEAYATSVGTAHASKRLRSLFDALEAYGKARKG